MKIEDIEKEYGVKFKENDKEKELSQWLKEQGLENLGEALKRVEDELNP